MPSLFRSFLAAVILTLALSSAARAQDAHTEARDQEARSLFEAGRTAFSDGRYDDARDYFQHAYELSGRSDLLYNIGTAEDRLRHDQAALDAFRAFLAASPEAENRVEVEARIAVLQTALDAAAAAATVVAPPSPPPPPPSSGPTLIWTWVAGGLALATGALAIGFWVAANDQYGALEHGCLAAGGCTRGEVSASNVETFVTLTNAFFVSAMVLTAATVAVLVIELTTTGGADTSVALRLGPGSLGLTGTF